jgi:hypothetical protein
MFTRLEPVSNRSRMNGASEGTSASLIGSDQTYITISKTCGLDITDLRALPRLEK